MATSDAYGRRLGERLRVENAPAIVTKTLRKAEIAVTEIRCDDPLPGMTSPVQREDAYLVGLILRDFPHRVLLGGGRQTPVCDLRAGDTCIHDLKRDPVSFLEKHHELFFYLPRAALNAIADDASAPRIGDLDCRLAAVVNDATIAGLGGTILPALSHPQQANRLFVDHVTLAVGAHVAQTYGGMRPVARPVRGGLAPWQERRAKEVLSANLDGNVPLKGVAREPLVSEPFLARVPPHHGRGAAQLAADAPHRGGQGEAARYPIVALGCGVGLRLRRSKPPDPGVHRNGRRQSGRLASGAG
jgi:AraC family transcriptional regulator